MPPNPSKRKLLAASAVLASAIVVTAAWLLRPDAAGSPNEGTSAAAEPGKLQPEARAIVLSPHHGTEPIDAQIRQMQQRITVSPRTELSLERLGRLFIAKARLSNDPGFYILAEQCGRWMEAAQPNNPEAWLLRGHALAAMHRFREAEAIARRLVSRREFVLDYALLGDALMEQGRLAEATVAYQQMVDLKPGMQSYTRLAHLRWLKGDLEGASEMMALAVQSGTARNAEPVVWASTRLASFRLQEGDLIGAERLTARALELVPDYAAALLMRGRILLVQQKSTEAIAALQLAVERNPLPEVQWILADAFRLVSETDRAVAIEEALITRGAAADPRSLALYLATRGERPDEALRLAEHELKERKDVFTYDALAWALWANGRTVEAARNVERALAEGTEDARLFLHAGVIALAAGEAEPGQARLRQANALKAMLLPSERALLEQQLATLPDKLRTAVSSPLTSNQNPTHNANP